MTEQETLDALMAAGLVEQVDGGLRLGDQVGLLEPAKVEALGRLVVAGLPSGTSALVIGSGRLDALLGYVTARTLGLRLAMMYDREGIGEMVGLLPEGARACLVTGILQDAWLVDQFTGVCRLNRVEALGVVALVSTARKDDRVTSFLSI